MKKPSNIEYASALKETGLYELGSYFLQTFGEISEENNTALGDIRRPLAYEEKLFLMSKPAKESKDLIISYLQESAENKDPKTQTKINNTIQQLKKYLVRFEKDMLCLDLLNPKKLV
ncbi:MAG: hypothetical protein WCW02_00270 [Candidatus Buchananbacteria bacterium]